MLGDPEPAFPVFGVLGSCRLLPTLFCVPSILVGPGTQESRPTIQNCKTSMRNLSSSFHDPQHFRLDGVRPHLACDSISATETDSLTQQTSLEFDSEVALIFCLVAWRVLVSFALSSSPQHVDEAADK